MARSYYRRRRSPVASPTTQAVIALVGLAGLALAVIPAPTQTIASLSLAFLVFAMLLTAAGSLLLWHIHRQQQRKTRALRIADVDHMTGVEFEHYIGELLKFQGYK